MSQFKYETHLHTSQGSACATCTGAQMARAYKEFGYTGMIVTDHFFYGNTAADRSLPWEAWVSAYCAGYEDAKKEGDRIGLQVFFGWESGYHGTEFLIYGLDKEWLLIHPEIKDATVEEQYQLIHRAGGLVIHAHPFREEVYIPEIRLFPEYVDGAEVINASNYVKHGEEGDRMDQKAYEYAKEHKMCMTAGSDIHSTTYIGGGMSFKRKLTDIHDFIKAVKSGEGRLFGAEHK